MLGDAYCWNLLISNTELFPILSYFQHLLVSLASQLRSQLASRPSPIYSFQFCTIQVNCKIKLENTLTPATPVLTCLFNTRHVRGERTGVSHKHTTSGELTHWLSLNTKWNAHLLLTLSHTVIGGYSRSRIHLYPRSTNV